MSILYSKAITAAIGKKIKNSLPFQHLHREEMTLNPYLSLRSLLLADLVSYKLLSFLSSNNSPNPNITLLQHYCNCYVPGNAGVLAGSDSGHLLLALARWRARSLAGHCCELTLSLCTHTPVPDP